MDESRPSKSTYMVCLRWQCQNMKRTNSRFEQQRLSDFHITYDLLTMLHMRRVRGKLAGDVQHVSLTEV
eukprot:6069752-Amphidinium_carterae.2